MKKYIWINTTFYAFHYWPEAPHKVAFLKHNHRHLFHIKVLTEINSDREVEFFTLKEKLDYWLEETYPSHIIGTSSCEALAEKILKAFDANEVSVSEDNENGALVIE